MVLEQFSDRFLHRILRYFGFGGRCGSGGKVVHLELFSDRFLHRIFRYFGFGGGCGSGLKVVYLELFSDWFLIESSSNLGSDACLCQVGTEAHSRGTFTSHQKEATRLYTSDPFPRARREAREPYACTM